MEPAPIRSVDSGPATKPDKPKLRFQTETVDRNDGDTEAGSSKRATGTKLVQWPHNRVISASMRKSAEDALETNKETILRDSEEHTTQYSLLIDQGQGTLGGARRFTRELYQFAAWKFNEENSEYPFEFRVKYLHECLNTDATHWSSI